MVSERQSVERVERMLAALGRRFSGRPKVRHFPIRDFVSESKRAFGVDWGSGREEVEEEEDC